MTIITLLLLVWLHFIADFVFQSHKMSTNKSSSNKWLSIHVGVYMIPFLIVFGPVYAVINAVLHFLTDYHTSRMTSRLWKEEKVHQFFVVIGLDQAIHATCLIITAAVLNTTAFGWIL